MPSFQILIPLLSWFWLTVTSSKAEQGSLDWKQFFLFYLSIFISRLGCFLPRAFSTPFTRSVPCLAQKHSGLRSVVFHSCVLVLGLWWFIACNSVPLGFDPVFPKAYGFIESFKMRFLNIAWGMVGQSVCLFFFFGGCVGTQVRK